MHGFPEAASLLILSVFLVPGLTNHYLWCYANRFRFACISLTYFFSGNGHCSLVNGFASDGKRLCSLGKNDYSL